MKNLSVLRPVSVMAIILVLTLGCAREVTVDTLVQDLAQSDAGKRQQAITALVAMDEAAVDPLIAALGDDSLQDPALRALAKIGEPAIGALIDVLADPDFSGPAARGLTMIGEPCIEPLAAAVRSPDKHVQGMAAGVLAAMGEPAVPVLINMLGDTSVQKIAMGALLRIGSVALPSLIAAVQHENTNVRRAAVGAIGQLKNPDAVPALILAQDDKDETVRTRSAESLTMIGEPAIGALAEMIKAGKSPDAGCRVLVEIGKPAVPALLDVLASTNAAASIHAIHALGQIKDDRTVEPLIKALNHAEPSVRLQAAQALGDAKDNRALMPLIAALKDDAAAANAIVALSQMGPAAAPPLIERFNEGSSKEKIRAAQALGALKSTRATSHLLVGLQSMDPTVRLATATALGQIGDLAAVKTLIDILDDETDISVRRGLITALGNLGSNYASKLLLSIARKNLDLKTRAVAIRALSKIDDPSIIEELLVMLKKETKQAPREAILTVLNSTSRPYAIPPFFDAMGDKDPEVREIAIAALKRTRSPDSVPQFIAALGYGHAQARKIAAHALVEIGVPAITPLINKLTNKKLRPQISEVLAQIGKPAVPQLVAVLGAKDDEIHRVGIDLVIKQGKPCVPQLIAMLKHENAKVRRGAATALIKINDRRALDPLLEGLQRKDLAVIAGAYPLFVPHCTTNVEPFLVRSLYAHGTLEMAQSFVASTNQRLYSAGRGWAERYHAQH